MKKLYTSLLALFITAAAYGQCTPNPPTTSPGIYPPPGGSIKQDSIYVLPSVNYNRAYNQTVQIVVPQDTTVPIPGGGSITADIDSMRVLSVSNMPSWLSYSCDNGNCSWAGGTAGCFSFTGTSPSTDATTLMIGEIEAFANLGQFGQAVDTFNVYIELTVGGTVSLRELAMNEPVVGPNPANREINVRFNSASASNWKFELMDLTGRIVGRKAGRSTSGANHIKIEREQWPAGVYLYRFSIDGAMHTGRIVVTDGL